MTTTADVIVPVTPEKWREFGGWNKVFLFDFVYSRPAFFLKTRQEKKWVYIANPGQAWAPKQSENRKNPPAIEIQLNLSGAFPCSNWLLI